MSLAAPFGQGCPQTLGSFESHLLHLEGVTIGLTHVFPTQEEGSLNIPHKLMERIFGTSVDVVVCGHTHVALIQEMDGFLMVNPGSATLPNNMTPQLGTVGLLEVCGGSAQAQLIDLSELGPIS